MEIKNSNIYQNNHVVNRSIVVLNVSIIDYKKVQMIVGVIDTDAEFISTTVYNKKGNFIISNFGT